MELRRVCVQHRVPDDRRRMDEIDQSGMVGAVRPSGELGAEGRPPRPLGPCSEGAGIACREAISRHAVLVGGDQREVRFADDERPDVHMTEQVRVAVQP
jgi:hypothetical protein